MQCDDEDSYADEAVMGMGMGMRIRNAVDGIMMNRADIHLWGSTRRVGRGR